jgi:hypothetical protein
LVEVWFLQSNGRKKVDTKWLDKARNRLLVVTLTIWMALAALVGRTWFLAIRYVPGVWVWYSLEVLAAVEFFRFFRIGYGWLFIAVCTSLFILLQVFRTRAQLRHIGKTAAGNSILLLAIVIVGIIRVMYSYVYFWGIILPYLLLLLVGLGLPGFLPTYVLYGRWETQHHKMLILLGWRLQVSK